MAKKYHQPLRPVSCNRRTQAAKPGISKIKVNTEDKLSLVQVIQQLYQRGLLIWLKDNQTIQNTNTPNEWHDQKRLHI